MIFRRWIRDSVAEATRFGVEKCGWPFPKGAATASRHPWAIGGNGVAVLEAVKLTKGWDRMPLDSGRHGSPEHGKASGLKTRSP
jgi:hypothetical protein